MTTQTKFRLEPRRIVPTILPYLIEGKDAPIILEGINGLIDLEYKGNPNLKILNLIENEGRAVVAGSSPLILPIVNRVVSPDFRVMRPEGIERTLQEEDPVKIEGNYYVDYGPILDFSGNNHDSAIEFYAQLPKNLKDFNRLPAVIVGYGLANSEKGRYGVCPTYIEGTELRTAKILAGTGGEFNAHDSGLIRSGVPSKVGSGTRTLYTSKQEEASLNNLGLSRLYLSRNLSLGWVSEDLAVSDEYGRVVLESAEGTRVA